MEIPSKRSKVFKLSLPALNKSSSQVSFNISEGTVMFMMPLGILKIKDRQSAFRHFANYLSSCLGCFVLHWVAISLLVIAS